MSRKPSKKQKARERRAAKRSHRSVEDHRRKTGRRPDGIPHQKDEQ
jgi:hypothetical protein